MAKRSRQLKMAKIVRKIRARVARAATRQEAETVVQRASSRADRRGVQAARVEVGREEVRFVRGGSLREEDQAAGRGGVQGTAQ